MVDIYLRAFDAPDLTHHHPQHVYESTTPCPLYSEKNMVGPCWHGASCSGIGPDCGPGEYDKEVICQLTTNVNESMVWCEECGSCNQYTQMKKSFQAQGTSFATVWHDTDTINLTTGRVETDARKFARHLRDRAEQDSERLGMTVDYQPVDPTDKDSLGVTDEGMDATHDRAVSDGRKDSRGRFVWQG